MRALIAAPRINAKSRYDDARNEAGPDPDQENRCRCHGVAPLVKTL
jgi:hypothetical protein